MTTESVEEKYHRLLRVCQYHDAFSFGCREAGIVTTEEQREQACRDRGELGRVVHQRNKEREAARLDSSHATKR